MPRPPLVQHEGLRTFIIAIITTLCLVGALALAHLLIVRNTYEQVQLEELTLEVPASWQLIGEPDPADDLTKQWTWRSDDNQSLDILRLSSKAVFNEAFPSESVVPMQPLSSNGNIMGLAVKRLVVSKTQVLQRLTVITQDEQTYWAVMVSDELFKSDDPQRTRITQTIYEHILRSLQLTAPPRGTDRSSNASPPILPHRAG